MSDNIKSFNDTLVEYRRLSFSERDKGDRFERLMQAYLQTDPMYKDKLKKVWMWNDFFGRNDLGGSDTGIDLVAQTYDGDYWAIQCKCYKEGTTIDKGAIDSFLSTSSREFRNEELKTVGFSQRLWIDTTGKAWGSNAEEAIKNQHPPFIRLGLNQLANAPVQWNAIEKGLKGDDARTKKKELFQHQVDALNAAHEHYKTNERGKLIMACGTGKTFTSLRIAEKETDGKGLILFLVPSIALLGQTLREWTSEANEAINAICICSDAAVTKKVSANEDRNYDSVTDLALPASTDVKDIVRQFSLAKTSGKKGMTVVFSTYQSIEVIANAQKELLKSTKSDYGIFDLIICDEAHRTTGVKLVDEAESSFIKVHNNDFLKAKKRMYMTATPRLYNDDSKSKAAQYEAILCSMDDVNYYGKEFYRIGFGEAVKKGLLCEYKVLILTVSETDMPLALQKMVKDSNGEIKSTDAAKLVGCINALSKKILGDQDTLKSSDPGLMKRAVAFCQSIKVSKLTTNLFNQTRDVYFESLKPEERENVVSLTSEHIDGTMSAPERTKKVDWLKGTSENSNDCRILTNVRCLSEGVDVPSLDAVIFLSPRNSQVDVVQSVGRVMRLSPATNKQYGYIIIPIVIPSDVEPEKALDRNEEYKVVWTVLNALRAHDEHFDIKINKIELNNDLTGGGSILVGRPAYGGDDDSRQGSDSAADYKKTQDAVKNQFAIQFEELQAVIYAKMVQKVGDKKYWEQWAKDVAQIAERHIKRITRLITNDKKHQQAFADFLSGLQKNINPSITQEQSIEMLAQHIITKPVFEALFEGYSFVKNNPISVSMQAMLDLLEEESLDKEDAETLLKFYDSVKERASGINSAEGKQKIIVELYDKFFKTAFPRMVEKLGIVYTPVEVVDFIVHSVNDVLKKEFNRSISDENIHILDPFTGTGTFVTRLLQSGLISKKDLLRKYQHEIHANEIVLLAYYIAAVNIENAFHDAYGNKEYQPFDGICLTDTFQIGESYAKKGELEFKDPFPQNSARVAKQKKAPLRVIMGNPPYSVGQKSANDDAQNQKYERLDGRIASTYAALTDATNKNSLYNSYMKAFRWSTDRLNENNKNGGIVCFVTDGGWIDNNSHAGFRKSLENEFTSIYVFNLRGNARSQGEIRRKEAGNVFGGGSRTPIAITLLIKNPSVKTEKAIIHYCDIGDYLNREEKLSVLKKFHSIGNTQMQWKSLQPNEHGDWISKRNDVFETFFPILPDEKFNIKTSSFFTVSSIGIGTSRDFWVYNFSKQLLSENITQTIAFYNSQVDLFQNEMKNNSLLNVNSFIDKDEKKISWSSSLIPNVIRGRKDKFDETKIVKGFYRPFNKQFLYFGDLLIHRKGQFNEFFPNANVKNFVICVSSSPKGLDCLITDGHSDYHFNGDTKSFPLFYYKENQNQTRSLFDDTKVTPRDGISDFILERAKKQYGKNVNKEDIFYYVYGFLHSPTYRETFANDLKKMLPRLPFVDDVNDFWAFSKAGRKLADLHINYETVPPYKGVTVTNLKGFENFEGLYKVEKMRFPRKDQKETIIYNSRISIDNIPSKAYQYVVNGKSAIEWIMERYQITTHKESGIKNDPNDWAAEVGNPKYILDLLLSIINVSVLTVEIVEGLPKLNFEITPDNSTIEIIKTNKSMAPEMILTAVNATLEAISIFLKLKDKSKAKEVIESALNASPSPAVIEQVRIISNLLPPNILQLFYSRIENCQNNYSQVLSDDETYLPNQIEVAGKAYIKCICTELNRLLLVNGSIPSELWNLWEGYNCEVVLKKN